MVAAMGTFGSRSPGMGVGHSGGRIDGRRPWQARWVTRAPRRGIGPGVVLDALAGVEPSAPDDWAGMSPVERSR